MSNQVPNKQIARERAAAVLDLMSTLDIKVTLVGSIVSGNFGDESDVDFLVTACPKHLKYRLESQVEDLMGDISFDVIYADETPVDVLNLIKANSASKTANA